MTSSGRALYSTLFFLSGAAGLLYEVCWTRLLRLPMGNTVYSLAVVLTAFMAGLAIGSRIAGRWIDRRGDPLRTYAVLEAGIGLFCLALPWIIQAEGPLFRLAYRSFGGAFLGFGLFKFFACALVVLAPATLMGATLPVLCRSFFDDPRRIGRSIGWLYAVNAFGAVAGSLLAGFVLIPAIGQRATIGVGVATSFSVAVLAWIAAALGGVARSRSGALRHGTPSPPEVAAAATPRSEPASGILRKTLLLGYGLSGLAAMVLQIAWTRVLALAFGSSVYAFALLVAAFILGLAIGSAVASRVADRLRAPAVAFAVAELGIGCTALAMVPVFQHYPEWMLRIVPSLASDFSRFQVVQFALVFVTLLLPTLCMGACLPFVSRALLHGLDDAAETVGIAYSSNAVGTIAGAFMGGFVLLPILGMHRTILFGAAINLLVGIAVFVLVLPRRRGWAIAAAVGAAGSAALILLPGFDPAVFTSGAYLYADRFSEQARTVGLRRFMESENRILLNREGLAATITVKDTNSGIRTLSINGKADASDDRDMATQELAGHLPCLLHGSPRDVAVIGLASGVTVHSVAQHPSVRSIDCVEIVPEMAEACRLFSHVNGGILDDPRLHLLFQDGRNHLTLTDRTYDVIVSEPSNPWISGIASLFTREFFQACHDRLRPGGMMCLWIHVYGLDAHAIRSVTRTFLDVFPDATLWETIFASDYQLVGCKGPLQVDAGALRARMVQPAVAADLARVGVHSPASLLVRNIADAEGMRRLASGGEIYHDDRNRLEFEAPRLMHQVTRIETLEMLQLLRQPGLPSWVREPGDDPAAGDRQALAAAQAGQELFWQGVVQSSSGNQPEATRLYLQALDTCPDLRDVWPRFLDVARPTLQQTIASGDTQAAEAFYRRILALEPDMPDFYNDYGVLLSNARRLSEAETVYRQALTLKPRAVTARLNLATTLALQGKMQDAEHELEQLLAERPDHLRARIMQGNIELQRRDYRAAESSYRAAVEAHPEAGQAWFMLGESLRQSGDCRQAVRAYETAVARDPAQVQAHRALAECWQQLGEPEKAARASARARAGVLR